MQTIRRTAPALFLAALAASIAACGQDAPRGDPLKGGSAPPAVPGAPGAAGELPPGHPPVLPPGHSPVDSGPKPTEMKPIAFDWTAPAGWTETKPSSALRCAQYEVAGKWADGIAVQCAFFANLGGGRDANIERWAGQFTQADGSASMSKVKTSESKAGDATVTRVELTGAFSDGMQRPPRSTDDGMLLGAIVESPDGSNLYVKLAGPRAAVEAEKERFDALIASFRRQ